MIKNKTPTNRVNIIHFSTRVLLKMSSAIRHSREFNDLIQKQVETSSPKNIIAHFSAKWCGPCKRMNPEWIEYKNTLDQSQFHILEVDVDINDYVTGFCEVNSVPTFAIIQNGTLKSKITNSNIDTIHHWIQENST
jgi:thioredoxin-like negative regulator of GroEL